MKRHLAWVAAAGVGVALIMAVSADAKREVAQVGHLFLADNGGIAPSRLPRHEQAPISAHIDAEIGTTDGSHPPAIRHVDLDFDKTIEVNAKGIPACPLARLEARPTAEAKKACPNSIVGTGEGEVAVEFAESTPFDARGPIVLFSGGVRGGTTQLYVHAYVSVPVPTAVVAAVKLTHIHRGHFGLHSVTQIPAIAGGAGSVTKFELQIDRRFTYKGRPESYLTASCPTGHYYTEGEVLFGDGTKLGLTHVLPCTPKG